MRPLVCALLLAAGASAFGHRLDGYLQVTTISLGRGGIGLRMDLVPGVRVARRVVARMDLDGDGRLSPAERRAYAARVVRDLALTLDGRRLAIRLVSFRFPTVEAMVRGVGDIELSLDARVLPGARRRLVFVNRHLRAISVYGVSCLAPPDPGLRVTAQRRNHLQTRYELSYAQA